MLFGTMEVNNNELCIGGMRVTELVEKHGTPLYVYDEVHIENMIDLIQGNFVSEKFNTRVAYASKAFLTKEMVRMLHRKKMSLDCVSMGEMYTAVREDYDMSNTIIHGNNKSLKELEMCFEHHVGYIVVDSIYELQDIIDVASKRAQNINILLRVNPGIEAHTHEYIITSKLTSKFGESIFDTPRLDDIVKILRNSEFVTLRGFHCHIGSQIFDMKAYMETIKVMVSFIKEFKERYQCTLDVLNIGGGFGVYYTDGDDPISLQVLLRAIVSETEKQVVKQNIALSELIIEPGRSIISNAGTTLYQIGYTKETFGGKNYVFVDGGMSDNIRPALYQAVYSADVATNMNGVKSGEYTVAGKLCESGDVLIQKTALQPFRKGDILAVYTTGAYNYSMSSNYNRLLRPEVVFVKNNQSRIVVKRETLEDLIRNDV